MAETVLARLAVQIAANTAEFGKSLKGAESQFKSFTNNISKAASIVGFGFGVSQIFDVLKSGIGVISDFEKEMSTVRAITGATGNEFDALRNSAIKLGGSTKYTAQQVASLQVEYGRLGFTTSEILAAQKATLDLATATGEDLAKSADVAGSTIRGFALNATETGRVVDVMAEAFNKSALSLENFSEAMKYVAPVAAQAGLSVEETTAMLGTLADAGIRGSQAGTSLRKIITDLSGESGTLSEKLQKLADKGLTGADAMSEVGRTAYASLLVLAKNTQKTEALTVALKDAAGAGAEAAAIMGDNLAGDVTKLSSAYDGLIISSSGTSSVFREFVQSLTSVLQALNSNNSALGDMIANYLKLALVVPRTAAKAIKAFSDILSENTKLTDEQVQKILKILLDLREKASLEGNQSDVVRYTLLLSELSNKYGLLKTVALEFKEAAELDEPIKNMVITLDSLRESLKKLNDDFDTTDENDRKKLSNIVRQITATEKLIAVLERLKSGDFSPNFEQQLSNADTDKGKKSLDIDSLKTGSDFLKDTNIDITVLGDSVDSLKVRYIEDLEAMAISNELLEQSMQRTADTAVAISGVIGDAVGNAFSGADNGVESLRKATIQIIDLFYKQALAAAIAKAIQSKGPLPFGLVAAGIGIAAVKSLFSRNVGKPSGGSGSGGGSVSSGSGFSRIDSSKPQDMTIKVDDVVLRGQDMYVILKAYMDSNKFTKTQNG